MKKWTAVLAAIALMLPQTAMGAVWKDEASAADETAMEVISEEASEEASEEEGTGPLPVSRPSLTMTRARSL